MACWYTLVLRYGTNRFYLAPRASITVEEDRDLEQILDGDSDGCKTCDDEGDREWKLRLYFNGGCDLRSAWSLHDSLKAFLEAACTAGDLTIERTVCRETPLVYEVKKAKLRMVDVVLQRSARPRMLSMELTLELGSWVEAGEGAVLVGA